MKKSSDRSKALLAEFPGLKADQFAVFKGTGHLYGIAAVLAILYIGLIFN